jgi:hypothetical protein
MAYVHGPNQVPYNDSNVNVGLNAQYWNNHQWGDISIPLYRCPVTAISDSQTDGTVVTSYLKGLMVTAASECPAVTLTLGPQGGSCPSCPATYPARAASASSPSLPSPGAPVVARAGELCSTGSRRPSTCAGT